MPSVSSVSSSSVSSFFEKKLAKSLREELVTLKGNKNMLHSYEKLSPQLGRKFFPTGAQNLETTAKEWRDGVSLPSKRRLRFEQVF